MNYYKVEIINKPAGVLPLKKYVYCIPSMVVPVFLISGIEIPFRDLGLKHWYSKITGGFQYLETNITKYIIFILTIKRCVESQKTFLCQSQNMEIILKKKFAGHAWMYWIVLMIWTTLWDPLQKVLQKMRSKNKDYSIKCRTRQKTMTEIINETEKN